MADLEFDRSLGLPTLQPDHDAVTLPILVEQVGNLFVAEMFASKLQSRDHRMFAAELRISNPNAFQ